MDRLVTIKSNRYGMELRMNPDVPFEEIQKAVVEKFTDAAGFFKNARMAISFTGRTLTATAEEHTDPDGYGDDRRGASLHYRSG